MQIKFTASPVDVPLVEQEPFLGLGKEHVHVLVDAPDNEDFVVVRDRLGTEELFGLLERKVHTLHLVRLRVEREAVTDPSIVSTEDQDLLVVEWEAAHRIASAPVALTVGELDRLPTCLEQVVASIESFNAIERLFVLGVTATDDVDIPVFQHADRVVMARLGEFCDLSPLVLCDFVNFDFLGGLVGVL